MVRLPTNLPDPSLRVLIVENLKSYPVERQRQECAAFGHGLELYTFDHWVAMARNGDSLIIPSLRLLVPPPKRGRRSRPTGMLNGRIADAVATGAVVIEGSSGARSDDRKTWRQAVESANNWVRSGGKTSEAAKRAGAKGGKKGGAVLKARSATNRWAKMPKLLVKYRALWRSGELGNDSAATEAINQMLIDEGQGGMVFGSKETARRVLGKKTRR